MKENGWDPDGGTDHAGCRTYMHAAARDSPLTNSNPDACDSCDEAGEDCIGPTPTKGKRQTHAIRYNCLRCKRRKIKCSHANQLLLLTKPGRAKNKKNAKGKQPQAVSWVYKGSLTTRLLCSRRQEATSSRASAHVAAESKTRRRRPDPTVTTTSIRHAGVGARRQSRWIATTTSRVCCSVDSPALLRELGTPRARGRRRPRLRESRYAL
jgi:hypothetical protein